MKTWETREGEEIPYDKIKNDHLLNILNYIKRQAKEGITVVYDYGYAGDDDYMTGEVEEIYGKAVLDRYDYSGLLKEKTEGVCSSLRGISQHINKDEGGWGRSRKRDEHKNCLMYRRGADEPISKASPSALISIKPNEK